MKTNTTKKIKVMIVGGGTPTGLKSLMDRLATQQNIQVELNQKNTINLDEVESFEYKMLPPLRDSKHERALEKQRRTEKNWKTKNRPWK